MPYKRSTNAIDVDALWQAVREVQSGQMGVRAAAAQYGIPRSTLSDHRYDKVKPKRVVQGRFHRTFDEEQEEELVRFVFLMSKRFHAMTRLALAEKAYKLAEVNHVSHPFKRGKAGKDCVTGFSRRHSNLLSMRTATPISIDRVRAFTKDAVANFFNNLEQLVTEFHHTADSIFNMDESGVTIVSNIKPQVVGQKGARDVNVLKACERGRLVTLISCFSAAGQIVPPLVIFPGNPTRDQSDKLKSALPGAVAANSARGWTNSEIFKKWLVHFKETVNASPENRVLLILDDHSSHVSFTAVEYAMENGIDMLSLPPHTSHKLQPLDVGFFSPLKNKYGAALNAWLLERPHIKPYIANIPEILQKPYRDASSPSNAVNAFRKTGIWVAEKGGPDRSVWGVDDFYPERDSAECTSRNTESTTTFNDSEEVISEAHRVSQSAISARQTPEESDQSDAEAIEEYDSSNNHVMTDEAEEDGGLTVDSEGKDSGVPAETSDFTFGFSLVASHEEDKMNAGIIFTEGDLEGVVMQEVIVLQDCVNVGHRLSASNIKVEASATSSTEGIAGAVTSLTLDDGGRSTGFKIKPLELDEIQDDDSDVHLRTPSKRQKLCSTILTSPVARQHLLEAQERKMKREEERKRKEEEKMKKQDEKKLREEEKKKKEEEKRRDEEERSRDEEERRSKEEETGRKS